MKEFTNASLTGNPANWNFDKPNPDKSKTFHQDMYCFLDKKRFSGQIKNIYDLVIITHDPKNILWDIQNVMYIPVF